MAHDDRRMHGHDTPGMVGGRGHQRTEEPVRLGDREPGAPAPDLTGDAAMPGGPVADDDTDRHQASALGGHTATRSSTVSTPADEQ